MISLTTLRRQLEGTSQVEEKFRAEGGFSITAAQFTAIAGQFDVAASEAKALEAAIGSDTAIFRAIPRGEGSTLPLLVTAMAYAGNDAVELRGADLTPLQGTITASRIGPGGYVIATLGKASVEIPTVVSDDLRNALISTRDDGRTAPQYEETEGAPALEVPSPFDGEPIPTMKEVPQRDLPPHAEEVPHRSDLEVVAVLELSRQYKSPRLRVKCLADGTVIEGLIATQPIVRCLTGQYEGEVVLTDAVVGQRFQILEVEDRRRRDGELVKGEDGKVQKVVVVRNTTVKREFSL
jgi:hypothetical protein